LKRKQQLDEKHMVELTKKKPEIDETKWKELMSKA